MSPRKPPPPHPQAHLPALDGHSALLVVNILERISNAIWRAHGHSMQATLEQARTTPDSSSAPDASLHDDYGELPF